MVCSISSAQDDAMRVQCPHCSAEHILADHLWGRDVQCTCGQKFVLQQDVPNPLATLGSPRAATQRKASKLWWIVGLSILGVLVAAIAVGFGILASLHSKSHVYCVNGSNQKQLVFINGKRRVIMPRNVQHFGIKTRWYQFRSRNHVKFPGNRIPETRNVSGVWVINWPSDWQVRARVRKGRSYVAEMEVGSPGVFRLYADWEKEFKALDANVPAPDLGNFPLLSEITDWAAGKTGTFIEVTIKSPSG
jgi:hypothetical protein